MFNIRKALFLEQILRCSFVIEFLDSSKRFDWFEWRLALVEDLLPLVEHNSSFVFFDLSIEDMSRQRAKGHRNIDTKVPIGYENGMSREMFSKRYI